MKTDSIFYHLKKELIKIAETNDLLNEQVIITGKDLSVEEAIGQPLRQDFPLQKGKEKLLTNGTINNFLITGKPVVFFGTTIAGAAYLMDLNRYCACGK